MKLLKFLLMFCAVSTLVSCGSDDPEVTPGVDGKLTLTASVNAISSDGVDHCQFIVKLDGVTLTDGVQIYEVGKPAPLTSTQFSSTKEGVYKFFAAYKTAVSEQIAINVLPIIAELPVDPQPTNTSFRRRLMGLQMTGSTCPACPAMIAGIRKYNENKADAEKVLFTEVHGYMEDGVMYSTLNVYIAQAYGTGLFPALGFNMHKVFTQHGGGNPSTTAANILKTVDSELKTDAYAGIAAAVSQKGEKIVVNVAVKVNVEGNYRVGAWLLEDNIQAPQANGNPNLTAEDNFSIHHNVVRAVDGRQTDQIFTGNLLGRVAAGATVNHVLQFAVNKHWNLANCKVIIFVTAAEPSDASLFYVTNAALCNLNATTAFDYK
ncbi:MAG: Omp28-related outer membrane protein [Alistipes sp.]